jgi:glycerophosphoryl diester phosphodiesterase
VDFNTLRSLRAVTGAGGGVGSELVPTLREALACAKGRCQLLVELKDEDIADRVVAEVTEAGMVDSCTISSFHEPSLQRCREVSSIGTCYFIGTNETTANLPVATLVGQLGVSLVCVVGAQKLALGPAPERAEAAAWLAQAREQGLQTRCGFADTISKEQARITFSVMVDELGVEEVSCGRPDWIAEFIRDHPG